MTAGCPHKWIYCPAWGDHRPAADGIPQYKILEHVAAVGWLRQAAWPQSCLAYRKPRSKLWAFDTPKATEHITCAGLHKERTPTGMPGASAPAHTFTPLVQHALMTHWLNKTAKEDFSLLLWLRILLELSGRVGVLQLILHTGDLRWHAGMAEHPAIKGQPLDVLYLDTTYCLPKHVHPHQVGRDACTECAGSHSDKD